MCRMSVLSPPFPIISQNVGGVHVKVNVARMEWWKVERWDDEYGKNEWWKME